MGDVAGREAPNGSGLRVRETIVTTEEDETELARECRAWMTVRPSPVAALGGGTGGAVEVDIARMCSRRGDADPPRRTRTGPRRGQGSVAHGFWGQRTNSRSGYG